MTGRWLFIGLAAACLAFGAVLAFAPDAGREAGPVVSETLVCSGCDARHAKLAEIRAAVEGSSE